MPEGSNMAYSLWKSKIFLFLFGRSEQFSQNRLFDTKDNCIRNLDDRGWKKCEKRDNDWNNGQ